VFYPWRSTIDANLRMPTTCARRRGTSSWEEREKYLSWPGGGIRDAVFREWIVPVAVPRHF
jgi:hypothetical protein